MSKASPREKGKDPLRLKEQKPFDPEEYRSRLKKYKHVKPEKIFSLLEKKKRKAGDMEVS